MIKNFFVNNAMNLIAQKSTLDDIALQEVKYGIEVVYLNISKLIVFFTINFAIGNFLNSLLFLLFYIPIKSFGWGFHAKTSFQCWTLSGLAFVGLPLLVNQLYFDIYSKIIICIFFILAMWCWAPADTPKRPLLNPKHRTGLCFGAIITTLIYSFLIFTTEFTNFIILALLFQTILINPFTYMAFNTQYKNHLYYKKNA